MSGNSQKSLGSRMLHCYPNLAPQQTIKQIVPLKYSKILNISQNNHRLSTTIIILLNLKDRRSKLQ